MEENLLATAPAALELLSAAAPPTATDEFCNEDDPTALEAPLAEAPPIEELALP